MLPDFRTGSFAPGMQVQIHLAGATIKVQRTPEVLGIQGKKKVVQKKLEPGKGIGQEIYLAKGRGFHQDGIKSYVYTESEPGFAETDLDEYDPVARELAWGRSLGIVRAAFGADVDIEGMRDRIVNGRGSLCFSIRY